MKLKLAVFTALGLGGLFLNLQLVLAAVPSLFVTHLGTNISEPPTEDWSHNPAADNGDFVQLYAEVGTHVSDAAQDVTVKFELPSSFTGTGTSTVRATSSTGGVAERSDSVFWNFRGAQCKLVYVPGSADAKLDRNRDGTREHDGSISDSIVTSGVNFGTFTDGVVQVDFKARVECAGAPAPSPSPTPTPAPSPSPVVSPSPTPVASPSPSPVSGGVQCPAGFSGQLVGNVIMCVQNTNTNTNTNTNSQTQTNNQNVTVNNPAAVVSAAVPRKQPETGLGVLGLLSVFGAGPVGMALARYGKGRVEAKEEDWMGMARGLMGRKLSRTHH